VSWDVKRLKFLVTFHGGGTPSKDNLFYWTGDIPWVSPKDMKSEFVTDSEDHITEDALASSATRLVQKESVLIVVRSGILKHSIPVAINSRDVALNQDMKALVPAAAIKAGYLKYLIVGHQDALLVEWRKAGATVESIEHDLLINSYFPVPSTAEQGSIAKFLDRETAKIDALRAKKERLIELLEEKRAALITRVVTNGLDPNVRMKDSGVEWLGKIPAHWEVGQLRRFWSLADCLHKTPEYVVDGIPIVSTTEVKPGRIRLDGPRKVSQADYDHMTRAGRRPRRGDVIYSRNASLGSGAYIDTDEPFCMGQDVCLITSRDRDQLYLSYQLNSPIVLGQIEALAVGSTFDRINVAQIKEFGVACPPREEQRAIADFLDRENSKIDELTAKVREGINKLKEYRTALISAAVTGKIDVREQIS